VRYTLRVLKRNVKWRCRKLNINPDRIIFSAEVSQVDVYGDPIESFNFQAQGIDMILKKVNDVIKSERINAQINVTDEANNYEFFHLAFNKVSNLVWETFIFGRGTYIWKTKLHKL